MRNVLDIENLTVAVAGQVILRDFSLTMKANEMHALMGRNGSGKTTLSQVIMGHPAYDVQSGRIELNGEDILPLSVDERARRGLFVAFQYPVAIPGVTVANFVRESVKAVKGQDAVKKGFRARVKTTLNELGIDPGFMTRYVNDGFSGGEKKRMEVLQLAMLEPKLVILDEIDSGLDIDTLKVLTAAIRKMRTQDRSFLVITHYHKMIDVFEPDRVHVLYGGKRVASGSSELVAEIDAVGYEAFYSQLLKKESNKEQ